MTQTQMILEHLKSGKTISPLEALNLFGCFRLAARIADIRKIGLAEGFTIVTMRDEIYDKYGDKKYVARYAYKEN